MSAASSLIASMIDAARKAARGLARDFGEVTELQVSKKGAADYVSAADIKAEQVLFEALTKLRPGYGFLGEERVEIEGTDKTHRWIVDPLDGTTNFLHAIPHFAVNIALERDGQIVAAVTYNPITHDTFWAEKGRGAWLGNEKRLRVADSVLQGGRSLTESLAQALALQPETRSLLATGEQAGQLEDALRRALARRRDVVSRSIAAVARRAGILAYAIAALAVAAIFLTFWTSYFARLGIGR